MSGVMIEGTTEERAAPGNLKAHVSGDKLILPKEVADAFGRQGIRTAEDLMSYIQSFPSSVADTLHWSMGDVDAATATLKRELKGHVADEFLQPSSRPSPPLGARNPDDLP